MICVLMSLHVSFTLVGLYTFVREGARKGVDGIPVLYFIVCIGKLLVCYHTSGVENFYTHRLHESPRFM